MKRLILLGATLWFLGTTYGQLDTITGIFSIVSTELLPDSSYKIVINAGKQTGVFLQDRASVLTKYGEDKKNAERDNQVIGAVKLIKIGKNTAEGVFKFKSGQRKHGLLPYDMVYTKIAIPDDTYRGLIFNMAKLNIFLNETPDMNNRAEMRPLYNWDSVFAIKNYRQEIARFKRYSEVIHSTRDAYGENINDYPVMLTPVDGGKFDNLKMYELLEQTTDFDIVQFFEFVSEYPYKYMGIVYPLDETYATWGINKTPLTKNAEKSISSYVKFLIDQKSLDEKINHYGYYLKVGVNEKLSWVDQYLMEDLGIVNQILKISGVLNLDTLSNYIKLYKGNLLSSLGDYDKAKDLISEVIQDSVENSNELNAYWYRSFINQELKRFDAAIADLDTVINRVQYSGAYGSKGWLLLKTGRWKEAREPIRKAYEIDSFTFSWVINKGHMYLTMGLVDSAWHFYHKSLMLASSEEELIGGLEDFELFINNGWYEKECQEIKDSFSWDVYSNGYLEQAKANYFLNLATNETQLKTRLNLLDSAHYFQEKVPRKDYAKERLISRWFAYTYYELKNYPQSLKWYSKALQINAAHLQDDNMLYADYTDLETLADYLNDEELTSWYGELKDGIKHKINVTSSKSNMLVFSCSSSTNRYSLTSYDDTEFRETISQYSKDQYDSVAMLSYSSSVNKDFNRTFTDFSSTASEEDLFVFYFSGVAYQSDGSSGLVVGSDSIATEELITSLTFLPTKNVLIVLDADNIDFIEQYVAYQSQLIFDQKEVNVQVLTPSRKRYEIDSLQHGILTYALLEVVKSKEGLASSELKNSVEKVLENKGYYFNLSSLSKGYPFPIIAKEKSQVLKAPVRTRGASIREESKSTQDTKSDAQGHYSLVIGVNNYKYWSRLNNPKNDATAVHDRLQSLYNVNSTLLIDPDLVELEAALRSLKNLNAESITIFYAGHGYFEEETQRGYLVLSDSKLPENDLLKATYFDHNRLVGLLENYKCKNVMLILDACFSGTIESQSSSLGEGLCLDRSQAGFQNEVYQDAPNKVYMKRHLSCPTMKYITSGGKEYVPDGSGSHSPFATKLIEALDTKGGYDGDGILSFSEIRVSLLKVTPQPRFGRFGLDNASTEFLFISE